MSEMVPTGSKYTDEQRTQAVVLLIGVLARLEAINNGADFTSMFNEGFLEKLDIWRAERDEMICQEFTDSRDQILSGHNNV